MKTKFFLLLFLLNPFLFSCQKGCAKTEPADSFARARSEMIERHLKWRNITNEKVLAAMGKVPREKFVPEALQNKAYADIPLPIGKDQTISQPYVVAVMTQAINPKPQDRVLEIGTGSGYQAAVLAEIVREVYTIEIVPDLAEQAGARLKTLGYQNIFVKAGDGYLGWPEQAPFDAIVITASPPRIPEPLKEQLKEGGRLIVPLGGEERFQELILYTKKNGELLAGPKRIPVMFVPMTGKIKEE